MRLYTKTTVMLDPVTEAQTIHEYEEDSNWVKTVDGTVGVVFEHVSPIMDIQPIYFNGAYKEESNADN